MSSKITALGFNFDATEIAPSVALEVIPAGWYSAAIVDGEMTLTEGGNGRRIALQWEILEGQYKGRRVFDGFNIVHSNPKAQQIAGEQLSAICHATNTLQVADVASLFNKPHQIKVAIDPARTVDNEGNDKDTAGNHYVAGAPNTKTYEAKNVFKGAKAGSAPVVASVATGAPGGPAPSWAAPKPAAAPTAAAGAPPWGAAPTAAAPAPTAAPAATPKGKPGRKPAAKPVAAPAAPKVERKFFVGLDAPQFTEAITETQLVGFFAQGMPVDTPLCLEGEESWKDAAAFGIGAAPAAPAPAAFVPPVAAPVAASATAPGGLPPWAK